MKRILMIIFLISLILLQACSSIDQSHAEYIARKFVEQRVKFFSAEADSDTDLTEFDTTINSYQEGKVWVVNMHVEAKMDNETKKNDIVIKVNQKGEVVEFNGNKVDHRT